MENNLQLYLDALRSGEFTQTTRSLREYDAYCCLGVACEVYRRHTGRGEWVKPEAPVKWKFNLPNNPDQVAFMPVEVFEWFGFSDPNPILQTGFGDPRSATHLNDVLQLDFKQIADAFERTFKE